MKSPSIEFHKNIINLFKNENEIFKIPIDNPKGNFKELLQNKLSEYLDFFKKEIYPLTQGKGITFDQISIHELPEKIEALNNGIIESLNKYLSGKPFEANKLFHKTLKNIKFEQIKFQQTTKQNSLFYRTRTKENIQFKRNDLFHIPFEYRTKVSTNRYSIPGAPALYLADNSYTCWKEYNQPEFNSLYFSVFENTKELNLVEILRTEDFLENIKNNTKNEIWATFYILRFLLYFPISIACTIKVHDRSGNFKPEYIISQMLIEYINYDKKIDGIKFPSTHINYNNLKNFKAYNYIFPVKQNQDTGYCPDLKNKFKLSSPSSLELEELLDNPYSIETQMGGGINTDENSSKISIIEDDERYYEKTSFGKIDFILKHKTRKKL